MSILEILKSLAPFESEPLESLEKCLSQEKWIDFSNFPLNDVEIKRLIKGLEKNLTVTSLSLCRVGIKEDKTLSLLADLLKVNANIKHFHLLSLPQSKMSMALRKITFDSDSDSESEEIFPTKKNLIKQFMMAKLISLSLCDVDIDIEALTQGLIESVQLEHLSLRGNGIDTQSAKILAQALLKNKSLTAVDVSNNLIGCEGGAALITAIKKTRITHFYCADNDFDILNRQILNGLENNSTLETLAFSSTLLHLKAGSQLCTLLLSYKKRQALKVSDVCIMSPAIVVLSQALMINKSLKTLDLTFSKSDLEHQYRQNNSTIYNQYRSLFNVIKLNKSLTNLHIKNIPLPLSFMQELICALQKNTTLTEIGIQGELTSDSLAAFAKFIAQNKSLQKIELNFPSEISAAANLDWLEKNSTLRNLSLNFNIGHLVQLERALKNNCTLIELQLCSNPILNSAPKTIQELAEGHKNLCSTVCLPYRDLDRFSEEQQQAVKGILSILERNRALLYKKGLQKVSAQLSKSYPTVIAQIIAGYAGLPSDISFEPPQETAFIQKVYNRFKLIFMQFKFFINRLFRRIKAAFNREPLDKDSGFVKISDKKMSKAPDQTVPYVTLNRSTPLDSGGEQRKEGQLKSNCFKY